MDIVPAGVSETLTSLFRLIDAIAIRHLCHGRYIGRVEFVQAVHVIKNRVQVSHHACALFLGQLQIAEISYVGNVFFCDFHAWGTRAPAPAALSGTTNSIRFTLSTR